MSSGGRAQNSWGTRSNGKGPGLRAALRAHVVTPGFAGSESSRGRGALAVLGGAGAG